MLFQLCSWLPVYLPPLPVWGTNIWKNFSSDAHWLKKKPHLKLLLCRHFCLVSSYQNETSFRRLFHHVQRLDRISPSQMRYKSLFTQFSSSSSMGRAQHKSTVLFQKPEWVQVKRCCVILSHYHGPLGSGCGGLQWSRHLSSICSHIKQKEYISVIL